METVLYLVAARAKRDQVVQYIVAEAAPFDQMVNMQILRRATILATPPVSVERLFAEQIVFLGTEFQSSSLMP